jgi:hypothetical protein
MNTPNLAGTVLATAEVAPDTTAAWHYAAWVSLDLRLLLFSVLFAGLAAAGLTAIFLKSERRLDYIASWLIAFVVLLVATVAVMNLVSAHPIFVVESFFPFP